MTDSPLWREVGLQINQYMGKHGHPPTVVRFNGDTGDVTLFGTDGTELARQRVFDKQDKTWNTPALAGDQLFVRNQSAIVCLKLPRR